MARTILTTCALDCAASCSILAHIDDGGHVRLQGNLDHPITRGSLCPKAATFVERATSPKRMLSPLVREGDRWREASWDQALDLVAERIEGYCREHGPLSIFYYQRWGAMGALKLLNRRFFNLLGGPTYNSSSLCDAAGVAGQMADFGGHSAHEPDDALNSRFIVLWGCNPYANDLHQYHFIHEARQKGAQLLVVDPRSTRIAKEAHIHLQLRPGSDIWLAQALAKAVVESDLVDDEFVESRTEGYGDFLANLASYSLEELAQRCDVPVEMIRTVARQYATNKPGSIWLGGAPQHRKRGTEAFRTIHALAALSGNIGLPGGGASYHLDHFADFDKEPIGAQFAKGSRPVPSGLLGEAILSASQPPVKALFCFGGNPLTQSPNLEKVRRAFRALDFVVVIDQFLTDTADYADVFLPTTHFLEEEDLMASHGHHWLGPITPVLSRPGSVRTDLEIVQGLGDRLGFGPEMAGAPWEWLARLATPILTKGVSIEELRVGPVHITQPTVVPFADGVFGTTTGRYHFITSLPQPVPEDQEYPFHFLSLHNRRWLNSQIPLEVEAGEPCAYLHSDAVSGLGLQAGDVVRLRSATGELKASVQLDDSLRPDVVVMYQGQWGKMGGAPNVLTSDALSTFGDSPTYFDTRVAISR